VPDPRPVLEGRDLTKRFGGVTAIDSVSLTIEPGKVTAVLGENGAGKSTLVACLSGALRPDSGSIRFGGDECRFRSPDDGRRIGIAVVHQEPQMFEAQTVAANIFSSRLARGRAFAPPGKSLYAKAAEHLESLGVRDLPVNERVQAIGGAQRQLIEIARALVHEPSVLFLDEPNASLGADDTARLFEVMQTLRDSGVAVVLISHRLREVYEIAEHIVVMRDGRKVAEGTPGQLPLTAAVRSIVGESTVFRSKPRTPGSAAPMASAAQERGGTPILRAASIGGRGFDDVSFEIHAGEIVGMAGLVGSGRTEIAHGLIGASRLTSGAIYLDDHAVRFRAPSDAVRHGVVFVPEGRRDAVFYGQSVGYNVRAGTWGRAPRRSLRSTRREAARKVPDLLAQLAVKAANSKVRASTLSGGNQQKLLLARALVMSPRLLILDEPTHGVDVGTKRELHDLIRALAADGLAVLFISSEVDEVVDLAQRIVVVRHGRISAVLPAGATTNDVIANSFGALDVSAQPDEMAGAHG
jgi:ABC-type sugar transport system ATPase subunit